MFRPRHVHRQGVNRRYALGEPQSWSERGSEEKHLPAPAGSRTLAAQL